MADATAERAAPRGPAIVRRLLASQETGLVIVVTLLTIALIALAGSHLDRRTGLEVNNFWNPNTLVQTLTDASFFAIMAIGATMVIISGGIDLSVGSIYALAGVTMALVLRAMGPMGSGATAFIGIIVCVGIGLLCGLLWEFWNYWAAAKWTYTIPFLGNIKIFEMPVLGFLGFPPFAVECWVLYVFARSLLVSSRQLSEQLPSAIWGSSNAEHT